jgi:hypothetical protein
MNVDGGLGGIGSGAVGGAGGSGTLDAPPANYKVKTVLGNPALVRQSTSWDLRPFQSSGTFTQDFAIGTRPLVPLTGDWNGDGTRTAAYYKNGIFTLYNTINVSDTPTNVTFGDARGFPVAGDWNGDGLDDLATYINGVWKFRITGCGTELPPVAFGSGNWPTFVPVAGDWVGDGLTSIGTYTPATGTWVIRELPSIPIETTISYPGVPGYYPVVGDWNADKLDTIGVKSTSSATWLLRNTNASGTIANADISFDFGASNDLPVPWGAPPN